MGYDLQKIQRYLELKKCRSHRKLRRVLRNLRETFFAQLFVFYFSTNFKVRDFLSFFFCATSFSLGHLKQRKLLKWGMHERFETNMEVTVN